MIVHIHNSRPLLAFSITNISWCCILKWFKRIARSVTSRPLLGAELLHDSHFPSLRVKYWNNERVKKGKSEINYVENIPHSSNIFKDMTTRFCMSISWIGTRLSAQMTYDLLSQNCHKLVSSATMNDCRFYSILD